MQDKSKNNYPILSTENSSSKKKQRFPFLHKSLDFKKSKNDLIGNEVNKYDYIYSPRTSFDKKKKSERKLFDDLNIDFNPIALKIIKSFFKERIGVITETEFIGLLKNHLVTWHPEISNREEVLISLISQLYNEIDLNNYGYISWEEFSTYLMQSSSISKKEKLNYDMRYFIPSKTTINEDDFVDIITYAFFIEKYNLIGVVVEGKSYIYFYDATSCKRAKAYIDIKLTQNKIDRMEYKELEQKAKIKFEIEEEEKKIKLRNHLLKVQQKFNGGNTKTNNITENNNNELKSTHPKKEKRENTPEKLKKEIQFINKAFFETNKKDLNKKLTILCTVFISEYDILLISSTNNKISAWQYNDGDFKNINTLKEEIINKNSYEIFCAILNADLPQLTMDWEPVDKHLFSGQEDGKILMWDIFKSKNIEEGTLDFVAAKQKRDEEAKNHYNYFINTTTSNNSTNKQKDFLNKTAKTLNKSADEKKNPNEKSKTNTNNLLKQMKEEINQNFRVNVSSIVVLGKLQMLAAGYYSGNVLIWDTMLKELRKFYSDQNTGIYQIAFDPLKNFIYSCGFDHNIFIYDPYIDGVSVNKLSGHNYSINSIACKFKENEFISIDIYGNIKIWDLDNMYNFQSINLNEALNLIKIQNNQSLVKKKILSNQKMIYLSKVHKIFTFGEKLMMFELENSKIPDLCDNGIVFGCFYLEKKYLFVTVCLNKIKFWNALNGKLEFLYENFLKGSHTEITSYCTDKGKKRIYVGDSIGNIYVLNLSNGKVLKDFNSHNNIEIKNIKKCENYSVIFSLGSDSILKLFDDKYNSESKLIKEIRLEGQINNIEYNETYSRLIIGTIQADVKYYDVEHLRQDSSGNNNNNITTRNYKNNNFDPISTIYTFQGYPICLLSYNSSYSKFQIIPPHLLRFRIFGEFKNSIEKNDEKINPKITSITFDKKTKLLFTSDAFGYVCYYPLETLFKILDENDNNITIEKFELIEKNFKMQKTFSFQAHQEIINHIQFPETSPPIIITSSGDRKVKLFHINNGEYIDEFKQSNERISEIPIGVRYYIIDPYISKIKPNTQIESKEIYRNDIQNRNFKKQQGIFNNIRHLNISLSDYEKEIMKYNAEERLYLLSKNYPGLRKNKSTFWNFDINVDEIINKEKKSNEEKLKLIEKNESKGIVYNLYEPLYSDRYEPKFISEMEGDRLNLFNELFSNKKRKVELTTSKLKTEVDKTRRFTFRQKGATPDKNIYMDQTLKPNILNNKNNSLRYEIFKNKLNGYKEDFDSKINDLTKVIQTKCANRLYNKKSRNSPGTVYKNDNNMTFKLPSIDFKYAKVNNEHNSGNKTHRNPKSEFSSVKKRKIIINCYNDKKDNTVGK